MRSGQVPLLLPLSSKHRTLKNSQGRILSLTFEPKYMKPFKLFYICSEAASYTTIPVQRNLASSSDLHWSWGILLGGIEWVPNEIEKVGWNCCPMNGSPAPVPAGGVVLVVRALPGPESRLLDSGVGVRR